MKGAVELLRTYKVGLRVPESLLKGQNELILELEVLSYIRTHLKGKPSKLMSGKVVQSASEIKEKYNNALKKYGHVKTLREASKNVRNLREEIKCLHWKDKRLNSGSFERADLPAFRDIEAPHPGEISITDYQNLSNMSLKMLCKHLNQQVLSVIDRIPGGREAFINLAFQNALKAGKNYTLTQIKKRFEVALSNITGIHSNTGRTAFYQLGMALKAHFDLRDKVEFVKRRLEPLLASRVDFSDGVPVLLVFYSIPNNLRKYVAGSWGVDPQWVRNTLVGWRRKIDSFLPAEFQIEPLTEHFALLAKSFKKHARSDDDLKVIGQLEGKHVLHLLSNRVVDLTPLIPQALHSNYRALQDRIVRGHEFCIPQLHSITRREFLEAAEKLAQEVQDTQSQFPATSQPHENCQGFINKINYLIKEASSQEFLEILKNYVVGNRFTSAVASLLVKASRYSKLFTALRGIIALTLARKFSSAIGQFLSAFNPDNCLTFPFTSKNRDNSHLPVNLLFNKYIVERKERPSSAKFIVNKSTLNKGNATDIFRKGKPIWLGLPIYSPHQDDQFQEVASGKRKTVPKKGRFWFKLIPSKKILECVRRGAEVRDIRLNVPTGPTKKIVADVVLSSTENSSFQHSGKFLRAWDTSFNNPSLPASDYLGGDFNRIGKYMVATASSDEEHDLEQMTELYENTLVKLEAFRKWEIPHVQSQLSTGQDKTGCPISIEKRRRLETQVTLLHQKRQKLMKEMKRQALMLYLYVAWKTKAKYISWDSIGGISNRGKKGTLANAITYLPKRKDLFEEFKQWACDLKNQALLPHYENVLPVSPFTSQICASCFQRTGRQERNSLKDVPYDEFKCKSCGRNTQCSPKVNRHSNGARVGAILLQEQVKFNLSSIS